ncbi:LuxR C-terminal-related transcriptional regulator [Microbacterium sp. NPDC096154]|uniref:LuxR C-terminal-related transcriptional regulator n=1 Tax=Microbacterium sp. NPDC096154 TaxID=3155549 RepID=UPI00332AD65C
MSTMVGEDPRVSAIFRALATGDYDEAIDLSERHWAFVTSFRREVKRAVADSLPDEVLARRPAWAVVKLSLAHTFLGRLRPTMWAASLPPLAPDANLFDRLAVHTAHASAARSAGRLDEALAWVQRARRQLAASTPAEREGASCALAEMHHEWGLVAMFAGRGDEAIGLFEQSFDWAEQLDHPRAAINAAAELAWLVTFAGHRGQALGWLRLIEQLRAANPAVQQTRRTDRIARAHLLLSELDLVGARAELEAVGDAHEHELLRCAVRSMIDAHDPDLDPATILAQLQADVEAFHDGWSSADLNANMIAVARARLHLRTGHGERALHAVQGVQSARADERPIESGRAAAVLYQLGEHDRAYAIATRYAAEGTPWPRMRVDALVVRAAVLLRRGKRAEAAGTFADALDLVADNRLLVGLAILPPSELRELADLLPAHDERAQLALAVAEARIAFPAGGKDERLTARERTVLGVLAEGVTVPEAARRLTVSANTVKTQLRSLYRKLGVHDRQALLLVARERGLL